MTYPRRASLFTLAMLTVLLATSPIDAQSIHIPTLQRGEDLESLDFLTGRWTGRLTRFFPDGETLDIAPTLDAVWSLGGAWLEVRDRTELPDGTIIHNRTWLTWDAKANAYSGAWQDNVLPDFVKFRGHWLNELRLELDTGEFELFGRPHRVVLTYVRVSDDEFAVEMHQAWDGAEPTLAGEGRFTRVRDEPAGDTLERAGEN